MAAFMNLRGVKRYRDRRDISPDLSKVLLRFESENVDFLTSHFLDENTDARGGVLTARKKMEIFLRCGLRSLITANPPHNLEP